jgi:CheY-like chemotaxis protein
VKTILLADDSITIQKVVELTFSDGEYRVLCVSNGAQALRKVAEARPDIVLLDVIMPEKNGYEVCEAMKADPATAGIPVLLLTGTFEPFDRQRADAAGAEGHLTKPFESHTLVARVGELIARAAETRAAPPPVPTPAAQPQAGFRMSAAPEPPATTAATAGVSMGAGTAARGPARPFAPPPSPETAPADGPHPAFAAPDAAAGGSYMGFADLAIGEDEVIPDRYDSVGRPATVRMARDEVRPPAPASGAAGPTLEGFVPGYDFPDGQAPPRAGDREEALGTPPPAGATGEGKGATGATAAPAGDAAVTALSDEALERLAEMIVRRMSDRVVREIAWEVIPGVAEAIVRQRIREIEGQER